MNIGVVVSAKVSDAAICEALEHTYGHLQIVRYQIPVAHWLPWLWKRSQDLGWWSVPGHLALSLWLRGERLGDRLRRQSVWKAEHSPTPSWSRVRSRVLFSMNEKQLIASLQGCDVILLVNQYRLTSRFYRQLQKQCIQIVWGMAPEYFGDSGAYWAYIKGDRDHLGSSVVLRGSQFNRFTILKQIPIACAQYETLRTLKVKQVLSVAKKLPELLRNISTSPAESAPQELTAGYWHAPTLATYFRFLRKHDMSIPRYAVRQFKAIITYALT